MRSGPRSSSTQQARPSMQLAQTTSTSTTTTTPIHLETAARCSPPSCMHASLPNLIPLVSTHPCLCSVSGLNSFGWLMKKTNQASDGAMHGKARVCQSCSGRAVSLESASLLPAATIGTALPVHQFIERRSTQATRRNRSSLTATTGPTALAATCRFSQPATHARSFPSFGSRRPGQLSVLEVKGMAAARCPSVAPETEAGRRRRPTGELSQPLGQDCLQRAA